MTEAEQPTTERRRVTDSEFRKLKKTTSLVPQKDGSYRAYPKAKHAEHQRLLKAHAAKKRRKRK